MRSKTPVFVEKQENREVTKMDLLDIAFALGVTPVNESVCVPDIRNLIRCRLVELAEERKIEPYVPGERRHLVR